MEQQDINNNDNNEEPKTTKKKFYKKWWFWLIVVLVVLIVGVGSGAGTSDGKGDKTDKENTPKSGYYIGDQVECSNWLIEVESVKISNWSSNGSDVTHFDITFYVTNTDDKEDTFKASYVTVSKDDYEYQNIILLDPSYFQTSRVCQPLIREKLLMCFEVPRGSNPEDFMFNVEFIIRGCSIYLKNR